MADSSQIAELRRLTDVAANDDVFTPPVLSSMIDAVGVNGAAASIWRQKAAKYASLVDVSESGSSRSMSQMYKNAAQAAKDFQDLSDSEITVKVVHRRTRVRSIERA